MANLGLIYLLLGVIVAGLLYFATNKIRQKSLGIQIIVLVLLILFWLPLVLCSIYVVIKRSSNEP